MTTTLFITALDGRALRVLAVALAAVAVAGVAPNSAQAVQPRPNCQTLPCPDLVISQIEDRGSGIPSYVTVKNIGDWPLRARPVGLVAGDRRVVTGQSRLTILSDAGHEHTYTVPRLYAGERYRVRVVPLCPVPDWVIWTMLVDHYSEVAESNEENNRAEHFC